MLLSCSNENAQPSAARPQRAFVPDAEDAMPVGRGKRKIHGHHRSTIPSLLAANPIKYFVEAPSNPSQNV